MAYLGDLNNVTRLSQLNNYRPPNSMSALETAGGVVAAATIDIGTTLWNSIIPEATGYEISTRDALQKIGYQGAITAYEQNREAVDALSFIGGVFIPGGAALKMTRAIRAGAKGINWLSQTRQFEDLTKIEKLVSEGAEASAAYKKAKASVFLRGQANNAIDTAATEMAIIATLNEHPYMEDYLKNPVENFATSFLIGGAIGGGIAAILNKAELNKIVGGVQSQVTGEVLDAAKIYTSFAADNGTNALSVKMSIDNLDELTAREGVSGLAKQIGDNWKINLKAQLGRIEEETFAPTIIGLENADARKAITSLISDTRFVGVEKITFNDITGPLDKKKGLFAFGKQTLFPDANTVARTDNKIVYDPKHNAFITQDTALQLGTIADLNTNLETLKKAASRKALGENTNKFRDTVFLDTTASVDKRVAEDFFRYNNLKANEFEMSVIESGDISKLNAYVFGYRAQVQRLQTKLTNPTAKAKEIQDAAAELDRLSNARVSIKEANGTVRKPLVATLDEDLIAAKSAMLRQLQANGVSVEVAAIKTNTPLEVVEAFANSDALSLRTLGFDDLTQLSKYNSEDAIVRGLGAQNRLLSVEYKNTFSNLTKKELADPNGPAFQRAKQLNDIMKLQQQSIVDYAGAKLFLAETRALTTEQKALLNNSSDLETVASQRYETAVTKYEEAMLSAHNDFVDSTLLQFDNLQLARQLRNDVINSYTTSVLREGVKNFVNAKGGNRFTGSADFATRNMEEAGRIATEIGDAKVEAANRVFKRLITPVTANMRMIANKPELMTELSVALNVRASNGGKLIYRDGQFVTEVIEKGEVVDLVPAMIPGTTTPFKVTSKEVNDILESLQVTGREIYEQQRVVNQLKGIREPSDIGFWAPAFNPVNKHVGYVQDLNTGSLRMFVGNTPDELTETMNAYPKKKHERLMTRDEVEKYKISTHGDLLDDVTSADATMKKQGIGLVTPDVSPQMLEDIVGGIRSRIQYQATAIVESSLTDVMQKLDLMSAYNQRATATQGSNAFQRAIKTAQTKDAAKDVKEIILGQPAGLSNPFMTGVNTATNTVIQYGIDMTTKLFNVAKQAAGKDSQIDYERYVKSLEAAGIDNPFKVFDEAARAAQYERALGKTDAVTPQRLVNTANAYAATIALRFGELAQPLVNMLSLPILQMSAISRAFKAESIKSGADVLANGPMAIMMNGVRRINSQEPQNRRLLRIFQDEGLLDSRVSEVDDLIREARFATGGVVSRVEKAIDSSFVNFMSKPSDYSDHLTRKVTLMTAVELATKLYGPNISDQRMLIFARDFLKQTIGNYSAAQRPAMFQGTFGAAMGLFQTYMLTYAQSMYRSIELQDFKGLGKMMLAQGGIFGAGSLPGFQPISELIGENFSDDHMDLVRGTYRALPDPLANVIMYGLPSNLAPAVHTRGDVNPRLPTGLSTMVAPSMIAQTMDSMVNVGSAIFSDNKPAGQAFMEALSMQSVSRPIARWSELVSGRAVTREGSQIAGPAEVWSWQGSLARVFGTRPLSEVKVREAIHLNTVYGAVDSENRRAVTATIKQLIRAGSLDEEALEDLAVSYLRTGSPQGFRAAVQEGMMNSTRENYIDLTSKLGDSPLMYMLEDIE